MSKPSLQLLSFLQNKGQMFLVCEILKTELQNFQNSLSLYPLVERGFLFLWLHYPRQFITCPISCLQYLLSLSIYKIICEELSRRCVTQLLLSHTNHAGSQESDWSEQTVTLIRIGMHFLLTSVHIPHVPAMPPLLFSLLN